MTIHDYYMCYYGNFKNSEQIYFLRSLKTDSGKNLPRPISEEIQPLTNYCCSSFVSPQVKQNYIIITTNWLYELPQKLSNDLKNGEILVKSRNWVHT